MAQKRLAGISVHNLPIACAGFIRLFAVLLLALALSLESRAQTITSNTDGATPSGMAPGAPEGAYPLFNFEHLNNYNGGLNAALPLLPLGGRGAAQFTVPLNLSTRRWKIDAVPIDINGNGTIRWFYYASNEWWQVVDPRPNYTAGVLNARFVKEFPVIAYTTQGQPYVSHYSCIAARLSFVAPDGTEYDFYNQKANGSHQCVPNADEPAYFGKVFIGLHNSGATFVSDYEIFAFGYVDPVQTNFLNGWLYLPNGARYRIIGSVISKIVDRNGNSIDFELDGSGRVTKITDSLGREVTFAYNVNMGGQYGTGDLITYNGFGGAQKIIRVTRTTLSNALRQGFSIGNPFPQLSGSNNNNPSNMAKTLWLPNGRKYEFRYNNFGEIARIELPTGGAIEYDYDAGVLGGPSNGLIGPWADANTYPPDDILDELAGVYRRLVTRRVYQDLNSQVYESRAEISRPESINASVAGQPSQERNSYQNQGYVEVNTYDYGGTLKASVKHYYYSSGLGFASYEDPYGSITIHPPYFVGDTPWVNGKEVKTEVFDVGSPGPPFPLLRRVEYALGATHIDEVKTTLADTNQVSKQSFLYDSYNNRTDVYEYDYGSGSPPANPVRHSHIDYLTTNSVNGLVYDTPYPVDPANPVIHIRNLPLQQIVYSVDPANGSETVVAVTEYKYDEAAYAPLQNLPAAVQWADPGPARGTATTMRRWLNISTNPDTGATTTYNWPNGPWLETHIQADVCGSVRKMWDARGKMSEIKYDGNFSDGSNHNAYAYPTQTLTPIPSTGAIGGLSIPFAINESLTTSAVYDFSTGKVVSTTDANNQPTTYSYADLLDRPTKVTRPAGGGETIYEYNDNPGTTCACDVWVKSRTLQSTGVYVEDYVFSDGLGRTWRAAHGEGGGKWSVTDTQFDSLGRVWKVSNPALTGVLGGAPTRGSFPLITANVTATTYDTLSRVLTVTTPDTSVVTTSYNGNEVTVADQANGTPNVITGGQPRNTTRRSVTDGLGRLKQIVEAPGSLGYMTNYTYDALDNLRQVNQGGQNRYFLYDSVGRLARARNPEQDVNAAYNLTDPVTGSGNNQWTLKYAYDENGNLKKRWDARGVAASYNYDNINRNYSIGYSGGAIATPVVERYYDSATRGKGRPWRTVSYNAHPVTGQAAYQFREITTYDENGRPTQGNQQFLNSASQWVVYTMSRGYDLMGHVTSQTYPSGRAANYSYTSAGRMSSFSGNLGDGVPHTYADQMTYNAAGQMTSERFGTQQQQLYHNMYYNLRHQMWGNYLGTTAGGLNRGALFTYYSVTARNIGDPAGNYSGNNGDVWMQEHLVPTNDAVTTYTLFRDIYEYDDLNRLKQDTGVQKDTANNWTTPHLQAFDYDQWGNRTINAGLTFGANITNLQFTVDTTNNRLGKPGGSTCTGTKNGMCYDQAGNLIFDNYSPMPIPGGDREYDGENRMTKGWGTGGWNYYVYDAGGQRVRRVVWAGGVQLEYWQVYGFGGELIAEYLANGAPATTSKEYGYRGGQLLLVGNCDVARWLVTDHLGSPRIEVDVTGSLANVKRHDYLSFGEELTAGMGNGSLRSGTMGYAADCVRQHYTGYERDDETGLDFAQTRYYSNRLGRFASVDLVKIATHRLVDPQALNLYTYVRNNPLAFADPDGMDWYEKNGMYHWFEPKNKADRRRLKKDGYNHVKNGTQITNAQAFGWMAQYNGHNVTLYNSKSRPVVDNGVYRPPSVDLKLIFLQVVADMAKTASVEVAGNAAAPARGASLLATAIILGAALGQKGDTAHQPPPDQDNDRENLQIYYHYSSSLPQSFVGGLWIGSSATTISGLNSYEASQGLGVRPPLYEYPVTIDPSVTRVQGPTIVQPSNRYRGGLPEVYFPDGTPPGSVGPPKRVPQVP